MVTVIVFASLGAAAFASSLHKLLHNKSLTFIRVKKTLNKSNFVVHDENNFKYPNLKDYVMVLSRIGRCKDMQ
jgi:hypothetical protein